MAFISVFLVLTCGSVLTMIPKTLIKVEIAKVASKPWSAKALEATNIVHTNTIVTDSIVLIRTFVNILFAVLSTKSDRASTAAIQITFYLVKRFVVHFYSGIST